jgi:hypothetical protein
MNIHEYQSKQILKSFGVNVPNGKPAFNVRTRLPGKSRRNLARQGRVSSRLRSMLAAVARLAVSNSPTVA